jgi:hypothetical protein
MKGMLDKGLTADLLEEYVARVESRDQKEMDAMPAAMRSAIRHLREAGESTIYSRSEVEDFAGELTCGMEIACYLETRDYYKVEGAIVYAVRGGFVRFDTRGGLVSNMPLEDYNRTWRLWEKRPNGAERFQTKWMPMQAIEKKKAP